MPRRFTKAPSPLPEPTPASIENDAGLAVCEVDPAGRVLNWSPGAERLLGWAPSDVIGRPLPGISRDDEAAFADMLKRSAKGVSFCDWPVLCQHHDGSVFPAVLATARLEDLVSTKTRLVVTINAVGDADEHAQLQAYAEDLRTTYARELERASDLERFYLDTVMALAAAIEAKDGYTGAHIRRVRDLGLLLARQLDPAMADDPQLAYGFLLHDIGKLSLPDAVLGKPGALDASEWALIAGHPEEGAHILSKVPFLTGALDIVLHHHERWDGGGYPGGLAGEEIPPAARLFAVADAVDAITSDRPYRAAASVEDALEEVVRHSGTQFDPAAVAALVELDPVDVRAALQETAA